MGDQCQFCDKVDESPVIRQLSNFVDSLPGRFGSCGVFSHICNIVT